MRTKLFSFAAAAAFLVAVFAVQVSAHHSFAAEFDAKRPVKLRGTVVKMEWINPHSWIHIDVKDPASGKVDIDRAYAEDEVNIRISELDRSVQERVSEVIGGIDAAASPLVSAADSSLRAAPTRSVLARQIVEKEFPWLKTRMAKDGLDKAWVNPGIADSSRNRLGLSKRLPPEPGTSPYETGIPPIPNRMPPTSPGS